MKKRLFLPIFWLVGIFLFQLQDQHIFAQSSPIQKRTKKATEDDDEVVQNKLFPKVGTIEIGGPDIGYIFNQSFIESFVFHANVNYYFREDWGLSFETAFSSNTDKQERSCIENFYMDVEGRVAAACPAEGVDPKDPITERIDSDGVRYAYRGASGGPAFIPIRELGTMVNLAAVWTPVYGKQLFLQKNTIYLDLFFTFGAGITNSVYYPLKTTLDNGNKSRGTMRQPPPTDCSAPPQFGVCPNDPNFDSYMGTSGRPEAQIQSTPTLTLGIGQKIHFWKRIHFKSEIRSYTLVGTDSGFDPFLMAWFGFGFRM